MVITYERRSGEDFLPLSGSFMMHIAEAAFRQAYPTLMSEWSTRERTSTSSRYARAAFVIRAQPKWLSMCQKQYS